MMFNQNMLTKGDLTNIQKLMKVTLDGDETLVRKEDISHLPTKEEFFKKEDELMGELKTMREEHKMLSNRVYEDHEPRITKIEKKLQIQTA